LKTSLDKELTVPHVFTLEGASFGADAEVVHYPQAGQPLAPHQAIVGPTRVATPVYGPGGTPIMYRRRYPARGPVCDYCDPDYFTAMNGGQAVIPFRRQQLGGVDEFLARQTPAVASSMIVGGALTVGAALSILGVWLYYKVGYRPKVTARSGWGGWEW
jgi:hypothetical protein